MRLLIRRFSHYLSIDPSMVRGLCSSFPWASLFHPDNIVETPVENVIDTSISAAAYTRIRTLREDIGQSTSSHEVFHVVGVRVRVEIATYNHRDLWVHSIYEVHQLPMSCFVVRKVALIEPEGDGLERHAPTLTVVSSIA